MEATNPKVVVHEVPPYLKVYNDGTIERLVGTTTTPPSLNDPITGVSSKDIVFDPVTGLSARLYRPANLNHDHKLPLVVYFHGGAFLISSPADPCYQQLSNILVKEANIILISVDYRKAPEHPLPTAYDDSWAAIQWVNTHVNGGEGDETWLKENVEFGKVYLAGDSAGANISHHMAIKAKESGLKFKIDGLLMVHPYFWGEEAIGVEKENPMFKGVVDEWWRFVCTSDKGCDDPLINPFADGASSLEELACERILVCVAGNDVLKERGKLYYESLVKSKWGGKVEFHLTEEEDHVFHIFDPTTQNAVHLIKKCVEFINHE